MLPCLNNADTRVSGQGCASLGLSWHAQVTSWVNNDVWGRGYALTFFNCEAWTAQVTSKLNMLQCKLCALDKVALNYNLDFPIYRFWGQLY